MIPRTLAEILTLLPLGDDRFAAPSSADASPRLFGGQVIAQALAAALATVAADRPAHALHANFLRAGDSREPLVFRVDRLRDGRAFSTRLVTAIQRERPILIATVSCQVPEPGLAFQAPTPEVIGPQDLRSETQLREDERAIGTATRWLRDPAFPPMHFELRPVHPRAFAVPEKRPPYQIFWFRLNEAAPADAKLAQCMLAYLSDIFLLSTTLLPHGLFWTTTAMQEASLDHSLWLHAPTRLDEWMLWSLDTPWSGGGRGLARGAIHHADGALIASAAQEGLIRVLPSPNPAQTSSTPITQPVT